MKVVAAILIWVGTALMPCNHQWIPMESRAIISKVDPKMCSGFEVLSYKCLHCGRAKKADGR
jgi:hypothetical protein